MLRTALGPAISAYLEDPGIVDVDFGFNMGLAEFEKSKRYGE